MKIETKYDYGQELHYKYEGDLIPVRVIAIEYRKLPDGPGVIYSIQGLEDNNIPLPCNWCSSREESLYEIKDDKR